MAKKIKKDKLNIAMIGHKRIPSREGGVEIVVEELATRMATVGHKVTCYNRAGHHVSGQKYDNAVRKCYKNVRLKTAWTVDRKGFAAVTSSINASLCAAFRKYDVVHYHAEGPCIGCFIPKLFGKRIVATIHGLDHRRAKWGKFAGYVIMRGEKNAVKYADEIIVLSEGVQKYFKEMYGRDTVYIPNGVNKADTRPANAITKKWQLYKDSYILYLGRIVPEKGAHYLIDAYRQLNTDKKLVIAGGASDSNEYMQKLRDMCSEYEDRIVFTDFIQGAELEELYSNAYLYVLPSDLEGMPLSLLEAMSYGNCCVTSDIEECTSVTGDYGLSFKAGNTMELSSLLQRLCDNPSEVNEYKNKAADYICEKYNWDEVTEKTIELYKAD